MAGKSGLEAPIPCEQYSLAELIANRLEHENARATRRVGLGSGIAFRALGFENAYALAMRRVRAEALRIHSIEDLARHAASLRIGADFEFLSRSEWIALRDTYGLHFATSHQYQSTFMYEAVARGEVDVMIAFSSDGRIAAEDLVLLEDPHQVILPHDALLLVSRRRSDDPLLARALAPSVGAISIESMREANLMVDRDADEASPVEAARWLAERVGIDC